jgi:tripartite-type tricarboxylate transporter receptor subunit TctC
MKKQYLKKVFRVMMVLGLLNVLSTPLCNAQNYPNRLVKLIVPFAPGGPSDIIARLITQKLSEQYGQSFIVENKPGGSSNIGIAQVAKSLADGYTLLLVSSSFVINPALFSNPGFDAIKDFSPVAVPVSSPNVLVVHPSFAAKNMSELLTLVKKSPGVFNYASPGNGTGPHLSAELLNIQAGIDMKHIPYNGGGPALQAVLGNQVPIGYSALPPAMAQIKSGKLIPLLISSESRFAELPNVPSIAEVGFPNAQGDTLQFVMAPKGTPNTIVQQLNQSISAIVNAPEMKTKLINMGYVTSTLSSDQTGQLIKSEIVKWEKVVRSSHIEPD